MPLMRNIGAFGSAKRRLLLSIFAYRGHNNDEATKYLERAAYVIEQNDLRSLENSCRAWNRGLRDLVIGQ